MSRNTTSVINLVSTSSGGPTGRPTGRPPVVLVYRGTGSVDGESIGSVPDSLPRPAGNSRRTSRNAKRSKVKRNENLANTANSDPPAIANRSRTVVHLGTDTTADADYALEVFEVSERRKKVYVTLYVRKQAKTEHKHNTDQAYRHVIVGKGLGKQLIEELKAASNGTKAVLCSDAKKAANHNTSSVTWDYIEKQALKPSTVVFYDRRNVSFALAHEVRRSDGNRLHVSVFCKINVTELAEPAVHFYVLGGHRTMLEKQVKELGGNQAALGRLKESVREFIVKDMARRKTYPTARGVMHEVVRYAKNNGLVAVELDAVNSVKLLGTYKQRYDFVDNTNDQHLKAIENWKKMEKETLHPLVRRF